MLLAMLALLAGCAPDPAKLEQAREGEGLPDWIERVHPEPGAEASPVAHVQVVHDVIGETQDVRLVVDGTDVTPYATRRGLLSYDATRPGGPVELDPGEHEASALLVSLDEFGQQQDVLDRFDWRFTIQ